MHPRPLRSLFRLLRTHPRLAAGTLPALLLAGLSAFLVLDRLYPFPVARLEEPFAGGAALILDSRGGVLDWRVDPTESWRLPVRLDRISTHLQTATVAAEDKRFWTHPGVDPLALARALGQNLASGRRVSGASTLAMQTIRLLWPRPRTLATKCVEMFRAVQLHLAVPRARILELYLNLAPYGGNVIGAEAAARRYFGKSAAELTLGEAALLAGVPQSPARFNPRRRLDAALRRRDSVLDSLVDNLAATSRQAATARERSVAIGPVARSVSAPRFSDYVLARRGRACGTVQTTLDPAVQSAALRVVRDQAEALGQDGIDGLAVVVIDVREAALAAMAGSTDIGNAAAGCINAALARRQPGSLLKPFIYAAAYDGGYVTPGTLLLDAPLSWRGYRPENMDRAYLGAIPAADALSLSRNIPAVRLLDRIGIPRLVRDINRLGLVAAGAEDRCGLSLALGTAEMRLLDLANAYAALARGGVFRPLRLFPEEAGTAGVAVYSPGAAYLLVRSLGAAEPGTTLRPVWKTGTSWHNRDAWAVAFTPRHVVAVWSGNLSGRGHPYLTGVRAALPAALEVLDRITSRDAATWPRPAQVRTRAVCPVSGFPATTRCPGTVEADYLPGISSDVPCAAQHDQPPAQLARRADAENSPADSATGRPGEPPFAEGDVLEAMRERRPSGAGEVAPGLEVGGPEHPAGMEASLARSRPEAALPPQPATLVILSPVEGGRYILPPPEMPASRELILRARHTGGGARVFWFVDGVFLTEAAPGTAVRWPLQTGRHELLASDGAGLVAESWFEVEAYP